MINIVVSIVLIVLIIILMKYQKEKFEDLKYKKDILMLQKILEKLKDIKKQTYLTSKSTNAGVSQNQGTDSTSKHSVILENADGSDTEHSVIDSLIYKRALLNSVKIEESLNELFRKLS